MNDAEQSSECSWHWAAGVSNDQSPCSEMVFTTSDWLENSLGRALHGTRFVQSPSYFYYWLFRPSFRRSRYSWQCTFRIIFYSINPRVCTLIEKSIATIVHLCDICCIWKFTRLFQCVILTLLIFLKHNVILLLY